jgi:hypothetical protein
LLIKKQQRILTLVLWELRGRGREKCKCKCKCKSSAGAGAKTAEKTCLLVKIQATANVTMWWWRRAGAEGRIQQRGREGASWCACAVRASCVRAARENLGE